MFRAVVENPDLSIIPDPGWPRVAVACRWKDAHKRREQWPHASVVGPLRTTRGIDLLVRSLLANPQIRIVVIDGADLSAGKLTTAALMDLWESGIRPRGMADDLTDDLLGLIRESVILAIHDPKLSDLDLDTITVDVDRPGGPIVLPPPVPVATTAAPHGDPGERVVGDTLVDVWPAVLQRIMDFGFDVPSQYGATREVLNMVSVFRDPRSILEDVDNAPWLGFTRNAMEEYARRVTTPWAPEDAPYSYGTRIGADGFAGVSHLLEVKVSDRGIGVSPWLPQDAGEGKGRPCLVWAQFRHVGDRLHLQVVFRSHDYFAAYPMNLAALASWLIREADGHSLDVGTMTCLSVSAHLYDRDWNDARDIIDDHLPKGHQWDPRSTWRVEVVPIDPLLGSAHLIDGAPEVPSYLKVPHIRATALTPDGAEVVATFEGRTAEAIQRKIERSGLLTTTGNAMWLGRELAKAEISLLD